MTNRGHSFPAQQLWRNTKKGEEISRVKAPWKGPNQLTFEQRLNSVEKIAM